MIDSSTNEVIDDITVGPLPIGIAFDPANSNIYVTNFRSTSVSVIATTTTLQPPRETTIISATDGNGNSIQNGGLTVSTSITFKVTATRGTNLIAGFECSLDGKAFSTCVTAKSGTVSYNNLAAGQQPHTFEEQ